MDTTEDEASIKTSEEVNEDPRIQETHDGEKGDVKMTEDEKSGDALTSLKDDIEVTSASLSYVEKLETSESALLNENHSENNSGLPQEVLTEGKTKTLETNFKSSNTEGDFDATMGIITSSEQSSNEEINVLSGDTNTSENKIEESCEIDELASFGNSNTLEGKMGLTLSEECSGEQTTTASQELNILNSETGEYVSQIRSCNGNGTNKISEQNSILEQNPELSTQHSQDGISSSVSADSFWEHHQELSDSNGETAPTVNEYFLELIKEEPAEQEIKIEESCEIEELIAPFGNSNTLEGKMGLTLSEECSNEQTASASEELNTLNDEIYVSQVRPCNGGGTNKISEQNSKSELTSTEHILEHNQELSTQHSHDGISSAASADSFWEHHQEPSDSNGETASTEYLLELNNEELAEQVLNIGKSIKVLKKEQFWELETEELPEHRVREPGIDKHEKSRKNALKVHFANAEKELGLGDLSTGGGEAEVLGVDLEMPEVKEELEDEEEFETGSSGSMAEGEGQEGDANFDETNICEYRSAFQRVVAQMLSEREAREAAQSKLYVVEVALEKCVSNDLANLRLALMHIQLLLREQNRARDDIVRTLKDKEDLNKLLEEKVLLLQNQKYELLQELNKEADRVQELERTNQTLVNILKRYGIKNC